jgi:hypothetical protein
LKLVAPNDGQVFIAANALLIVANQAAATAQSCFGSEDLLV